MRGDAPEARFWAKVDKTADCWLWVAYVDENGYGRFRAKAGAGGEMPAHHFLVGRPAAGYEWDHLCRVTRCVRPIHLELVTRAENLRREWLARHSLNP